MELKQRFSWLALVLYLSSSVYIAYLANKGFINEQLWSALFWIILLFVAVNAVAKGFAGAGIAKLKYSYTLVSLPALISGKIFFNTAYLLSLSLTSWLLFILFFKETAVYNLLFVLVLFLSNIAFAGIFSMMSALSVQQGNSITLITILGFPIVLPVLLLSIKLTTALSGGYGIEKVFFDYVLLALLDLIIISLSYLLFPYLCRD